MECNYLDDLNEPQREAVVNFQGPCMIVAGAGSGKTRVLTYRIAHMLQNGVPPFKIMALTFTNKAAREMRERIARLVGEETARSLWMGTFHSIFARILRAEAESIGFESNFTILDAADSQRRARDLVRERKLDPKDYKPSVVCSRISRQKNNLKTPAAYKNDPDSIAYDRMNRIGDFYILYEKYCERCKTNNSMDFDDILLYMNFLLRDNPAVLRKYQNRFSYILVDEYQDTNVAQYRIVQRLAAAHNNVCVVGDDAQSIYAFRGARIENILSFDTDYPQRRLVRLEQNYRSTQTIVNAANSLISNNERQIKKNVFSRGDVGEPIRVLAAPTDSDEGFKVCGQILSDIERFGLKFSDVAILYRSNAQSRIFEEAFRRALRPVPYRIVGGLRFFERKEVQDCMAYFKLAVNPLNDDSLKRVINYPARGIGERTLDKIEAVANKSNVSMWVVINNEVMSQLGLKPNTLAQIFAFRDLVARFSQLAQTVDAYDAAVQIVRESGVLADLQETPAEGENERVKNVEELLNTARDHVATNYNETGETVRLSSFVQEVALQSDVDTMEEGSGAVTLMTAHASKGLEFDAVYVVGMEEGLFPSRMSSRTEAEVEEERRLFYVAMTRARKLLTLSWAKRRAVYGSFEPRSLSRFAGEISPEYLAASSRAAMEADARLSGYRFEDRPQFSFRSPAQGAAPRRDPASGGYRYGRGPGGQPQPPSSPEAARLAGFRRVAAPSPASAAASAPDGDYVECRSLSAGQKVEHQQFGRGVVVATEGQGAGAKAVVRFATGNRTLLLRYARLKLVDAAE